MTSTVKKIKRTPIRWNNLEIFLQKAKEIHGDKYDYILIKPDQIKNLQSYISIICKICNYRWPCTVSNHIYYETGCADCAGNAAWTLVRFISKAKEIHGNRYDYSKITDAHIKGRDSCVPVVCRLCFYEGYPTIYNHINGKHECLRCCNQEPWTLDSFLDSVIDIHGKLYDYSLVREEHIKNANSKIPIICNLCFCRWTPTISNHISHETGCPACKNSKGEFNCKRSLVELGIPFSMQFKSTNPQKMYDFIILYNGVYYILEYDGEQHFNNVPHFHKNGKTLELQKQRDIKYTFEAIKLGYKIIRIDYTEEHHIKEHIINALTLGNTYYLSSLIYSHILQYLQ